MAPNLQPAPVDWLLDPAMPSQSSDNAIDVQEADKGPNPLLPPAKHSTKPMPLVSCLFNILVRQAQEGGQRADQLMSQPGIPELLASIADRFPEAQDTDGPIHVQVLWQDPVCCAAMKDTCMFQALVQRYDALVQPHRAGTCQASSTGCDGDPSLGPYMTEDECLAVLARLRLDMLRKELQLSVGSSRPDRLRVRLAHQQAEKQAAEAARLLQQQSQPQAQLQVDALKAAEAKAHASAQALLQEEEIASARQEAKHRKQARSRQHAQNVKAKAQLPASGSRPTTVGQPMASGKALLAGSSGAPAKKLPELPSPAADRSHMTITSRDGLPAAAAAAGAAVQTSHTAAFQQIRSVSKDLSSKMFVGASAQAYRPQHSDCRTQQPANLQPSGRSQVLPTRCTHSAKCS